MTIRENNFLYGISSVRQRAFSFLKEEMEKIGVADIPPSYGDILYAAADPDGVSLKEISTRTYKDKSTVSLIVNALEKSGYLVKDRDAADGRAINVKLTPKAREHTGRIMAISSKLNNKLFAGMSTEEKTIFFLLLNKIAANL